MAVASVPPVEAPIAMRWYRKLMPAAGTCRAADADAAPVLPAARRMLAAATPASFSLVHTSLRNEELCAVPSGPENRMNSASCAPTALTVSGEPDPMTTHGANEVAALGCRRPSRPSSEPGSLPERSFKIITSGEAARATVSGSPPIPPGRMERPRSPRTASSTMARNATESSRIRICIIGC